MKQKFIATLILFIFTLFCVGAYIVIRERKLNMFSNIAYAQGSDKTSKKENPKKNETTNKTNDNVIDKDNKQSANNTTSPIKDVTNDVLTPDPSIAGKVPVNPNPTPETTPKPEPGLEVIRDNSPLEVIKPSEENPSEEMPVIPEKQEYVINEDNYQNITNLENYDVVTIKGDIPDSSLVNLTSSLSLATVNVETASLIKLNSDIDNLNIKADEAQVVVNQNVNNAQVLANDVAIKGSGTINKMLVKGEGTKAFVDINTVETAEGIKDLIVNKEKNISIAEINVLNNSSVSFTLNKTLNSKITLDNINISFGSQQVKIYNAYTDDNIKYTLITSPLKKGEYDLYLGLPNGNVINSSFNYDAMAPSVTNINVARTSASNALFELYGLDTGASLYYIIQEDTTWSSCSSDASCIMEEGVQKDLTQGYNKLEITGLEADKNYRIYYVLKNEDTSKIYGPYDINKTVSYENPYYLKRATEVAKTVFTFELNKAPNKTLTLDDFTLTAGESSNLSLNDASLIVSDDGLTYVIKVQDNYNHNANNYNVQIDIDGNIVTKDFTSDLAYPLISKQKVVRVSDNLVTFTFDSDEAGTIYYGLFEDTKAIYNGRHATPVASDVMDAIASGTNQIGLLPVNSAALIKDTNTLNIDITNYPLSEETRIWVLFADEAGNYKTGFVECYGPVPSTGFDFDNPSGSNLAITSIEVNNPFIKLTFNDEFKNFTSKDISFAIVSGQEARLLNRYFITAEKNNLDMLININNPHYYFPKGTYDIIVSLYDKDDKWIKVKSEFTID